MAPTTPQSSDERNASNSDTVDWNRLSLSPLQQSTCFRQDMVGVPIRHGQYLLLGGNDAKTDGASNSTRMLDLDARRSVPFPQLRRARMGAVAVQSSNNSCIYVAGGCSPTGRILKSMETLSLNEDGENVDEDWEWKTIDAMPTARAYAAAVSVPTEDAIVIVGGRGVNYQSLDSVDILVNLNNDDINKQPSEWKGTSKMPGPCMGCASVLLQDGCILVLGGYDGRSWQRTCWSYGFSSGMIDQGTWSHLPNLLETVRYLKAVVYYHKYVLVMGEMDDDDTTTVGSKSINNRRVVIQCYDSHQQEWIWAKTCTSCPPVEFLHLQEPFLYAFSSGNSSQSSNDHNNADTSFNSGASVYSCELSKLDPRMVCDVLPVVVGAAATTAEDMEAPTIMALNPVLVAEVNAITTTNSKDDVENDTNDPQPHIKLRHVVRVKLSERSFYTGQLRKQDGTYVPHGQGLLMWVEEDKAQVDDSFDMSITGEPSSSSASSYYKGQFHNGFRHGLGEMYLRIEDKHYFGSFDHGSWEGLGSLKIRSRGLEYFGHFSGGEMMGQGRCSFRVRQNLRQQWQQKTYSGGFRRGLAHGRGIVSDYVTGKIDADRMFEEEDLFQTGSVTIVQEIASAARRTANA